MKIRYWIREADGRECEDEMGNQWWECLRAECDCEGIVVRHGTVPSAEERTEAEYVREEV